MQNTEFKGMVAALEKVSGDQKRVTGLLLEKLEVITENLIKIIEEHDIKDNVIRFDFKGFGFRVKGSNVGGDNLYFCDVTEEQYETAKVLPHQTKSIDSWTYLHGDFNAKLSYMNRKAIIDLCEVLPEFIINMTGKIQSLTDKETKYLQKFID